MTAPAPAKKKPTRTETDTFGPIEVAADKYWGAQAQRSLGGGLAGAGFMLRSHRPGDIGPIESALFDPDSDRGLEAVRFTVAP